MNPVLLGILVAAFFIWRKIKAAQQLDFSFGIPYGITTESGRIVFTQPIELTNREGTQLNISGVNLNFTTAKNVQLGSTILAGRFRVPPNSSTVLPLKVSLSIAGTLQAAPEIRELIKTGTLNVNYSGLINAEGFSIPIGKQLFTYQFPNFSALF